MFRRGHLPFATWSVTQQDWYLQTRDHGHKSEKGWIPLHIGGEVLSQVEDFKYFQVIPEWEKNGAEDQCSAADSLLVCCIEDRAEPKHEDLCLLAIPRSFGHKLLKINK